MSGPEFFQTRMGQRFYEGTMPALVKQLERLNDNLEAQPIPYVPTKVTELPTASPGSTGDDRLSDLFDLVIPHLPNDAADRVDHLIQQLRGEATQPKEPPLTQDQMDQLRDAVVEGCLQDHKFLVGVVEQYIEGSGEEDYKHWCVPE
jgi:hypothetical protein